MEVRTVPAGPVRTGLDASASGVLHPPPCAGARGAVRSKLPLCRRFRFHSTGAARATTAFDLSSARAGQDAGRWRDQQQRDECPEGKHRGLQVLQEIRARRQPPLHRKKDSSQAASVSLSWFDYLWPIVRGLLPEPLVISA